MSRDMAGVVPAEATTPCAPLQTWRRPRRPETKQNKRQKQKINKKTKDKTKLVSDVRIW
jgi:hypothetical protein